MENIEFELRNEIKIVKQKTSSLDIEIEIVRDLVYVNQDNIKTNHDDINSTNVIISELNSTMIKEIDALKTTFKEEVTEFQCPANSNKLGQKVCNLDSSVNEHENDINTINAALNKHDSTNNEQNGLISQNSKDISALDTDVNSKLNDVINR